MRRFRVIQGGKQARSRSSSRGVRLYKAYSIGSLTKGENVYHDVKFNWYCLNRPQPVAPYDVLIENIEKLDERLLNILKRDVDRYFTEEEASALESYLDKRYGLDLITEEIDLPIKGRSYFFEKGGTVIYDFLELSEKESYSLPFKVWGYYTISGCLSTPSLENAVQFIRKSFELLGLPLGASDRSLENVAKRIYKYHGLIVKSRDQDRQA